MQTQRRKGPEFEPGRFLLWCESSNLYRVTYVSKPIKQFYYLKNTHNHVCSRLTWTILNISFWEFANTDVLYVFVLGLVRELQSFPYKQHNLSSVKHQLCCPLINLNHLTNWHGHTCWWQLVLACVGRDFRIKVRLQRMKPFKAGIIFSGSSLAGNVLWTDCIINICLELTSKENLVCRKTICSWY